MKMPFVHHVRTRVGDRRTSTLFYKSHDDLPIPRIVQLDEHSCGFLAALAVAQYFYPQLTVREVLRTVGHSPRWGINEKGIIRGLKRLGIKAEERWGLGWAKLKRLTSEGTPVITCIWPNDWDCSHWTAIRGLKGRTRRRVLLSNYPYTDDDGSIGWYAFQYLWNWNGWGIVCSI